MMALQNIQVTNRGHYFVLDSFFSVFSCYICSVEFGKNLCKKSPQLSLISVKSPQVLNSF